MTGCQRRASSPRGSNLSRGSLREAVRGLALVRVLEVRQGDGTYVTSLKPDLLLETISFFTELQAEEASLRQILEARRMLEAGTAALAAQLATAEELADARTPRRRDGRPARTSRRSSRTIWSSTG